MSNAKSLLVCVFGLLALSCGEGGVSSSMLIDVGDVAESADGHSGFSGVCAKNDDCPEGYCNPVTHKCVECLNSSQCPEGMRCVSGRCLEGTVCVPGTAYCDENGAQLVCNKVGTGYLDPEPCDDGVECTLDSCVDGVGCRFVPQDSMCDDGNECTVDICDPVKGCDNSGVSPECEQGGIADASPVVVKFPPTVPGDEITHESVAISNIGLGDLMLLRAKVLDKEGVFFLFFPPEETTTDKKFDPPVIVNPGKSATLTILFVPEQIGEFDGTLEIHTNDATKPEGLLKVNLQGEAVGQNCLEASPKQLNFGAREVGETYTMNVELKNCGDGLVPIYDVALAEDTAEEFSIASSLTPPYDLDVGQSTTITIAFKPAVPGKNSTGALLISNGTPKDPVLTVELLGTAIAGNAVCPIAVAEAESGQVSPGEIVALSGLASYGLSAEVVKWLWTVKHPVGAHVVLLPSPEKPVVKTLLKVAGQYLFTLQVWDEEGHLSCNKGSVSVDVVPEQEVYIELVWQTPGDPDELDEGPGADLDLHFVSPKAGGEDRDDNGDSEGWFDKLYDCWVGNKNPNWNEPDPEVGDDPQMIFEDANGAGPESIGLNKPADGSYKVGVHYREDDSLGPSSAIVRVYAHQGLALETLPVSLSKGDMWDVMRLEISGKGSVVVAVPIEDEDGQPSIMHNYPAP